MSVIAKYLSGSGHLVHVEFNRGQDAIELVRVLDPAVHDPVNRIMPSTRNGSVFSSLIAPAIVLIDRGAMPKKPA